MEKCNIKILNQTQNGKIFRCLSCNRLHVEYNNLYFTFTDKEFRKFRKYFLTLDAEYWEEVSKNEICNRKIMIPVGHDNLVTLFNVKEVNELKELFESIDPWQEDNSSLTWFNKYINISRN